MLSDSNDKLLLLFQDFYPRIGNKTMVKPASGGLSRENTEPMKYFFGTLTT